MEPQTKSIDPFKTVLDEISRYRSNNWQQGPKYLIISEQFLLNLVQFDAERYQEVSSRANTVEQPLKLYGIPVAKATYNTTVEAV